MLGKAYHEVTIQSSYIRLPVQLRYTFPGKFFRPYLQAGVMNDILLNQSSNYIYKNDFGQVVNTYEDKEEYLRKVTLHNTVSAGIERHSTGKHWWYVGLRGGSGTNIFGSVSRPENFVRSKLVALQAGFGF
jgi:hypothetical protein